MNNTKLVSVNITTFNRESLLPRCLDSVLKQNYQNIEIIVVDDCSDDGTIKVLKKYQKKDDRIKFFKHKKNKGNAYARNTCLKNSKGIYIAFMDDDDEWIDKNKIKKQVDLFEKNNDENLGIVCSGILRCKFNGQSVVEESKEPKNIKQQVLKGGVIHNSTVLTKKTIIEKVGGFDQNVCRGIDSEFFRRLIVVHNYNVIFMKDITCKYYETSMNRLSNINNKHVCLDHMQSQIVNIKKYFFYLILHPQILFNRFLKLSILAFLYLKFITYSNK